MHACIISEMYLYLYGEPVPVIRYPRGRSKTHDEAARLQRCSRVYLSHR
jgi:hypothetical protein